MRQAAASLIVAWSLLSLPSTAAARLDYRSWFEGTIRLIAQSIRYGEARVYDLGSVDDSGIFQAGMLISEDSDVEDRGTKNVVLMECGMHAREWFAAESCYWLIDYLLSHRRRDDIRDLLAHADVWIIPQSNPAGRDRDDRASGDPTRFAYMCYQGGNAGKSCDDDSDCPAGTCYTVGWRGNTNPVPCPIGVDLARNFSSGWNSAVPVCTAAAGDRKYRGPAPFSERETLNVRRFVHNHMTSMVLIVHTTSQKIWNRWDGSPPAHAPSQFMDQELGAMNASASREFVRPGAPDPTMHVVHVGGGTGQFSGWLTEPSNVVGELDEGTERNISTFYFELPIYPYGRPFQATSGDGSNGFHPSSRRMHRLWRKAIRDLQLYVVLQARSPQCPVDSLGARLTAQCLNRDFGLVGAKIGDAADQPGRLDYDLTSRAERLPSGTRQVVFAVQNHSASPTETATNATVTVFRDGGFETTHTEAIALAAGERATYTWSHSFVNGSTYRVELALDADDFGLNNRKSFAFNAVAESVTPRARLGRGHLRARMGEQTPSDDNLRYQGRFLLDTGLSPDVTGVDVTVNAHQPFGTAAAQQSPGPVVRNLPSGSPWWDGSKPEKGTWVFNDPGGQLGAVTRMAIRQRPDRKSGRLLTRVKLRMTGVDLSALADAQAYTVTFDFPGKTTRLVSLALTRGPEIPKHKVLPDNEPENEPGS